MNSGASMLDMNKAAKQTVADLKAIENAINIYVIYVKDTNSEKRRTLPRPFPRRR